jgi:hypothetical protein
MAQISENIRTFTSSEGIRSPQRQTEKIVAGGLSASALVGCGTLALGVLGLLGVLPAIFLYLSVIAAGVAMVLEAGAFAYRFREVVRALSRTRGEEISVEGGISAEALSGVAAVVLGVLALIGVYSIVLASTAMVVIGAGLALDVIPKARMTSFMQFNGQRDHILGMDGAVFAGAGGQLLLGLGVLVLGVLALAGVIPLRLDLIAAITAGCAILLGSGAIGYRTFTSLKR